MNMNLLAARHGEEMHMDMDADSMSSTSAMSMPMMMVFNTARNTALYSTAWTPNSTGAYAGTCIFLIILALILRGLYAFRAILERRWLDKALKRRYVVVAGQTPEADKIDSDADSKTGTLVTAQGLEERVKVVRREARGVMPWRFEVDLVRAVLVTVIVGIGYLLMLAVMTMNVGYFMAVLGGTFLGEVGFGRYSQSEEH